MSEGVEDANVCSINNRNRCDGMRVSLWLDFNSYRFRDGRPSERAATGKATVRAALVVLVQASKAKQRIQKVVSKRNSSSEISSHDGANVRLPFHLRLEPWFLFRALIRPGARPIFQTLTNQPSGIAPPRGDRIGCQ